jgi:hypothetical protein
VVGGACRTHRRDEKCIKKTVVGKPEGKRPLERPRHRVGNNTGMNLREITWKLYTGFIWLWTGTNIWLL